MQLLMRQMCEARGSHNVQVLALRQRKRELVGRLTGMCTRLAVLGEQLGSTGGAVWLPLAVTAKQAHQVVPGELAGSRPLPYYEVRHPMPAFSCAQNCFPSWPCCQKKSQSSS